MTARKHIPDESGDLRVSLGLPRRLKFRNEPAPRKPDVNQLRALHKNELDAPVREEVLGLVAAYREWHNANRTVLWEILGEHKQQ